MSDGRLGVLFRPPRFPVIVFGRTGVGASKSIAGLAKVLATLRPSCPGTDIKIVDSTAEEFWFDGRKVGDVVTEIHPYSLPSAVTIFGSPFSAPSSQVIVPWMVSRIWGSCTLAEGCLPNTSPDWYLSAVRTGSHRVPAQFEITPLSPHTGHHQRNSWPPGWSSDTITPEHGTRPGRLRQRTPVAPPSRGPATAPSTMEATVRGDPYGSPRHGGSFVLRVVEVRPPEPR